MPGVSVLIILVPDYWPGLMKVLGVKIVSNFNSPSLYFYVRLSVENKFVKNRHLKCTYSDRKLLGLSFLWAF